MTAPVWRSTILVDCEMNVDDDPLLSRLDLSRYGPGLTWQLTRPPAGGDPAAYREQLRAFCATADAGLSLAEAALAETGTIVVSSGANRSRLISLLPPVHLALVPASRLTSDLFTWAAARQDRLPAAVTLIGGPSKTADIEATMVHGAHGPREVHLFVINELTG